MGHAAGRISGNRPIFSRFPDPRQDATSKGSNTEHEVMNHIVEAVYENGILRPEQPLPLPNRQRVRLVVERLEHGSHSVLDIPPVSLGETINPLQADRDLLGEMLEGR
jgi:predicted DNA-binding antitoxin AbrB/MazE fold protein